MDLIFRALVILLAAERLFWLARNLPEVSRGQGMMQAAADAVRENGEAVSAVMDLAAGRGDRAVARKEVADAVAAAVRLAAVMEAGDGAE